VNFRFNPIATSKLKFALNRVLTGEKLVLSDEMLLEICESSNGDLRNAINTLQVLIIMRYC
jgi:DNA polymerase III delta prime subunit